MGFGSIKKLQKLTLSCTQNPLTLPVLGFWYLLELIIIDSLPFGCIILEGSLQSVVQIAF